MFWILLVQIPFKGTSENTCIERDRMTQFMKNISPFLPSSRSLYFILQSSWICIDKIPPQLSSFRVFSFLSLSLSLCRIFQGINIHTHIHTQILKHTKMYHVCRIICVCIQLLCVWEERSMIRVHEWAFRASLDLNLILRLFEPTSFHIFLFLSICFLSSSLTSLSLSLFLKPILLKRLLFRLPLFTFFLPNDQNIRWY